MVQINIFGRDLILQQPKPDKSSTRIRKYEKGHLSSQFRTIRPKPNIARHSSNGIGSSMEMQSRSSLVMFPPDSARNA